MKCSYCKQSLGITESYYNIRELHKSKGTANRWKIVGQCCETCYDAGNKVTLEILNEYRPNKTLLIV